MSKAKELFNQEKIKILQKKLEIKNKLAVPKPVKVVINVGIGQAGENPKFFKSVQESLMAITGQKPKTTRARQAIAGFKIRKKEKIGMMVTLRGARMFDFIYKLAHIVLPRLRDFRGLSPKGFDKNGHYTLGLTEQMIFPEISHEKSDILHGMSITMVTTAKNPEIGEILLEALGFPFKKGK